MISFGKGMQKNVTEAFKATDLFSTVIVMPGGPTAPSSGDPDGSGPAGIEPGRKGAPSTPRPWPAISRLPGVETAYPDINFPALVGLEGEEEFRLVQVVPAAVAASKAVPVKWGKAYTSDDTNGVVVSRSFVRRLGTGIPRPPWGRR
ncbi:MAG: hypothetical protein MZV64_43700 [Ignavibacteriales bacterium]|nr:hypothetical protein [Ignavibacteriales bacterium]